MTLSTLAVTTLALFGCEGEVGPAGPAGPAGEMGETGEPGPGEPCDASAIELPGANFFPEGVAAATNGTLYVGSLATGEILSVEPCGDIVSLVPPGPEAAVGLDVDDAAGMLWACRSDLSFSTAPALVGYDLVSGAQLARHAIGAAGSFCNDFIRDTSGDIFITDSTGHQLYRVPGAGAVSDDSAEPWLADPIFDRPVGEFGLNGIAIDGSDLYVVSYNGGDLFRVPLRADGSPGAPVSVTLDRPLAGADGLELLAPGRLLVVEGFTSSLSIVDTDGVTGIVSSIDNRLDAPTTVAITEDDGQAWVAEGQLDHLLGIDPAPASVPFLLRRTRLP